jgi:Flp pilus assembly protein TadD
MFHRRLAEHLLFACLLVSGLFQLVPAQNRSAANVTLTQVESRLDQGKLDEAEKLLLDFAVTHPNDAKALELLGQIRYQQGRLEEARALYRRVATLNPTALRIKINLAQLSYLLGEPEGARILISEILGAGRLTAQERLVLARVMVQMSDHRGAVNVIDGLPTAIKRASALPLLATAYLRMRELENLKALIPSMRRVAISNADLAVECAEVLQQAEMSQEAVALLKLALARAPNNFRGLMLMGRIQTTLGKFSEARIHLNQAAKLMPNNADILLALGNLESAQGNSEVALSNLQKARAQAPTSTSILSELVVVAMRANQPQVAFDAANALLQLKPENPEYLYLFGAASLQNGNLGSAQRALEQYQQQRPEDFRACLALGITYLSQQGQQQNAKSQFERCLKLNPANPEPKYQLGLLYKSEGQVEKAIEMFREVTRVTQHANALRELGSLYLQSGDEKNARGVLERAVALNATDAETHFLLSRVYSLMGDSSLARQHLDRFKELKSQREKTSAP